MKIICDETIGGNLLPALDILANYKMSTIGADENTACVDVRD